MEILTNQNVDCLPLKKRSFGWVLKRQPIATSRVSDMEGVLNMNATSYYGFNNCGLLYATPEQSNPALASAQRALDLYSLRTRNAPSEPVLQQHQGNFHHTNNKRERKTQANRSRTMYNKRLLVNARERERMKTLNKGFENLRNALPCYIADGHISKITTLRLAINYIKSLSAVLQDATNADGETLAEKPNLDEHTPCNGQMSNSLTKTNLNDLRNKEATGVLPSVNVDCSEIGRSFNSQFAPCLGLPQKTA